MGLPIGQAPVALVALSGTRRVKSVSLFDKSDRPPLRLPGKGEASDKPSLFSRPRRDTVQIGRSAGIVSSPGAALNTVTRSVKEGKKLIPSIKELEIGFRRNASESRAQTREQFRTQIQKKPSLQKPKAPSAFERHKTNRVELRLPNPSAQARNFISALNETAGELQATFSGEERPRTSGASFRINGESFPIADRSPGARLNITV